MEILGSRPFQMMHERIMAQLLRAVQYHANALVCINQNVRFGSDTFGGGKAAACQRYQTKRGKIPRLTLNEDMGAGK